MAATQDTVDKNPKTIEVSSERVRRVALPMGVLDFDCEQDGSTIYAACMDGVYAVARDGGERRKLYEHDSYVSGVVRLPQRPILISAGYDGQLIWFDLESGGVFRRILAHDFWSWDLALSPDGHYVATAGGQYLAGGEKYEPSVEREPSVKVFDATTGDLRWALSHLPPVQSVAISRDNRYVAAGNLMGEVRVWDLATGESAARWTTDALTSWGIIKSHCYIGGIYAMQFDVQGDDLYVAGMGPMRDPMAGNGRQLWQRFAWHDDPVRKVDETHEGESGEGLMETLAFHPSRPLFLMGGRLRGGKWNAAVFSTTDGARLHDLNTGYRMTSATFVANDDREQLILAGMDKQVPPKGKEYPPFGVVEVYDLRVI